MMETEGVATSWLKIKPTVEFLARPESN